MKSPLPQCNYVNGADSDSLLLGLIQKFQPSKLCLSLTVYHNSLLEKNRNIFYNIVVNIRQKETTYNGFLFESTETLMEIDNETFNTIVSYTFPWAVSIKIFPVEETHIIAMLLFWSSLKGMYIAFSKDGRSFYCVLWCSVLFMMYFSMLHFFHVAPFSYSTFFVLHSFYVVPFFSTCLMLHSLIVALFSCCIFFKFNFFHIIIFILMSYFFHITPFALCLCCTFSLL